MRATDIGSMLTNYENPEVWQLETPGAQLHVWQTGHGDPLVLVHGTGTDHTIWDQLLPHIVESHTVIRYDRRGYGVSVHDPVRDYRVHISDLQILLEHLGPAHVVGWSSGGNTALGAAVKRPDLFRSLTVLEAPFRAGRSPSPALITALLRANVQKMFGKRKAAAASFFRVVSLRTDGPSGWDRLPAETQTALLGNAVQVMAEFRISNHGPLCDFIPLGSLNGLHAVPVAWAVGSHSPSIYRKLRRHALKRMPGATEHVFDDASHFALVETPSTVAQLIKDTAARST